MMMSSCLHLIGPWHSSWTGDDLSINIPTHEWQGQLILDPPRGRSLLLSCKVKTLNIQINSYTQAYSIVSTQTSLVWSVVSQLGHALMGHTHAIIWGLNLNMDWVVCGCCMVIQLWCWKVMNLNLSKLFIHSIHLCRYGFMVNIGSLALVYTGIGLHVHWFSYTLVCLHIHLDQVQMAWIWVACKFIHSWVDLMHIVLTWIKF